MESHVRLEHTLACLPGLLACLLSVAAASPVARPGPPASVKVHDHVALVLSASDGPRTPAQRAAQMSETLGRIIDDERPGAVLVELGRDWARVRVGDRELVKLIPLDAVAAGSANLDEYATRVQGDLSDFLSTERQRARMQNGVLRASLVVFFAVLGFLLLRLVLGALRTLEHRLARDQEGLPRDLQKLARGPWRSFAIVGLAGLRLLAILTAGFVVLLASLSLFDSTRPWRDRLGAGLAEPFSAFAHRLSSALPNLLLLGLLALVVRAGWQAVTQVFERAAIAPPHEGGLPPDRIRPYRLLSRAALVLFSLLMLPFVLGGEGGILTAVGLVGAAALALAFVPLAATVAIGAWAIWTRLYRPGEWLKLRPRGGEEICGQVIEVDFTHLRLSLAEGGEVRLPHLSTLLSPVVRAPAMRGLSVELPVERARLPPVEALRLLEDSARGIALLHGLRAQPAVTLVEVNESVARFKVCLPGAPDTLRTALLLSLVEAISAPHHQPAEGTQVQ